VSPETRGRDKSAHEREREREEENTESSDQMWMFIVMNELGGRLNTKLSLLDASSPRIKAGMSEHVDAATDV